MGTQCTPVEALCVYSEDDASFVEQLEHHLSGLQREGRLSIWHKRLIKAGSDQQKELDRHLDTASLILLLISSDFLASDYCYSTLTHVLQRHKAKKAQVISILLRPCDWQSSPVASLEVLPTGRQPIRMWGDQDDAWDDVTKGIHQALGGMPRAEEVYRQKVLDTYQRLDFTDFNHSNLSLATMPLEKVFVYMTRSVDPEPVSDERGEHRQQKPIIVQKPIELGQALNNHLLILGEAGSGKSTLLRWLAVTFAQGPKRVSHCLGLSADADRLPILISLGRLPNRYLDPKKLEKIDWGKMIEEYLTTELDFTDMSSQVLTKALNSDSARWLLLLDGLDEVANHNVRSNLVNSLKSWLGRSKNHRAIVSSRLGVSTTALHIDKSPADTSSNQSPGQHSFWECHIERFTLDDLQQFFRSCYAPLNGEPTDKQRRDADALYTRVLETPAAVQLATTPLQCNILRRIWERERDLPKSRVKLYECCCYDLVKEWEATHSVAYLDFSENMHLDNQLHLLEPVAYFIHNNETLSIARTELLKELAKSFQKIHSYSYDKGFHDAALFLEVLSLRSDLLRFQPNETYGFPHLAFQEYLAARYIAAQPDYIDLVMANLHKAWWREVHLLTIASLGSGSKQDQDKAAELILKILNVYALPSWILRPTKNRWWREHGPGKLLPQIQLERRIAWMLDRELELAVRGYAECTPNGTMETVGAKLSKRAEALVWHTLNDDARYVTRETLLTIAGQLLRHGDDVVKRTLQKALHNPAWKVQGMAKDILKELEEDAEKVVSDRQTILHGTDWDERGQAASLGQVEMNHEEVVSGLLTALRDPDGYVRLQAAASLGKVGVGNKKVVSGLLTALRDPDGYVRRMVALSLGQVGEGNEEVVKTLLAFLNDPKVSVRMQAAESLGKVGTGNERGTGILLAVLYDRVVNKQVQVQVAGILGKAGNQAGVDALLVALRGPDMDVRFQAAENLEQVGRVNQAGVEALLEALHDPDRDVRYQAALSLGQMGMGNEKAASDLLEALHDPDRDVRYQAALSLGQMGVGNEEMMRVLLAALCDPNWDVRDWAALYLGRLEIKEEFQMRRVLVALNCRLHDEESNVRQTALMAIRQLLDGRPIPGYQEHVWVSPQEP